MWNAPKTALAHKIETTETQNGERLNRRQLILGLVLLAALVALCLLRTAPTSNQLARSPSNSSLTPSGATRHRRWAASMSLTSFERSAGPTSPPPQKVTPLSLLGSQVMGFTAIALIGRVADPVRPYLICKENWAVDRSINWPSTSSSASSTLAPWRSFFP